MTFYALFVSFFFFNDTATTEIYTLSLHDALPISSEICDLIAYRDRRLVADVKVQRAVQDRKSTRLNSSHSQISYAVFCLKKKKKIHTYPQSHNSNYSGVPDALQYSNCIYTDLTHS